MAKNNSKFPYETMDQALDALSAQFGSSWSWLEIAEYTLARSSHLPEWQVEWAREFMQTRRQQHEDVPLARTPVDISKKRSTRVPRGA